MLRLPSSPIVGTSTSTALFAALLGFPYRPAVSAPESSRRVPLPDASRLTSLGVGQTSRDPISPRSE
jgi:hypothetical protein